MKVTEDYCLVACDAVSSDSLPVDGGSITSEAQRCQCLALNTVQRTSCDAGLQQ